ncbi:MAG TPA: phytoene desaturase family protein [Cyclobacteriaceae bacterium]|nr:phytoene desaturase family protein [Cyclobacteriaceae bacterium]
MKQIAVIGSGFAGLSAATSLASEGYAVTIYEKNATPGGRARKFMSDGFTFDMGPSWYWMPDVFEAYFNRFGKKTSDYYELVRLNPSYRVYFSKEVVWDIPADQDALNQFFEAEEPGSSSKLQLFLKEAEYKYKVGINDLVYKPGLSITELLDLKLAAGVFKLHVFQSISKHIRSYFKSPRLIQLLEFPVLFLGASPQDTPALYSLMNYADMKLGTWYPKGGMYEIVDAMVSLAKEKGVHFEFNSEVRELTMNSTKIKEIQINGSKSVKVDAVVAGADYHHVEQNLLPPKFRRYTESYWQSRKLAPSSIIFYLGVNKKLDNLLHHNLFFDEDFERHTKEIYESPQWPTAPLFYVCCPSKTDDTVAPKDAENLFILIPVAPGLTDDESTRDQYYDMIMARLEQLTKQSIRPHVIYKKSYAHRDFIADYNSFKGNAYGLANTIGQTANLKPSILNKKVSNLFYTGQLTVPGPGVPPSLISGQVVARELTKRIGK